MKHLYLIPLLGFVIFSTGCNTFKTKKPPSVIRADSFSGAIIADTIIYDVIIKNANPEDMWADECLKYLRHTSFIDSLFDLVYTKQATAYDFFSKRPLKIKDVRQMEKDENFNRKNIGKIQFTERWYFDVKTQQLQKEVMSIVLGHELTNDEGLVRGYKPVFQLYLNH